MASASGGTWRVQIIGGSAARPSHCGALLSATAKVLAMVGIRASAWDIGHRLLPPAGAVYGASPGSEFVRTVRHAHALVLVTPLYHNSFSGLLKNAIDHLGDRDMLGKPVALMSTTGGIPSPQALDHLRVVVRALHGIALPSQVIATDDEFKLEDGRYQVASRELADRICGVANELLWFAERLRPEADGAASATSAAAAAP